MIKITVDNIKDYIFAKAMIESFTDSKKLFYRLATDFLLIEDPEVDVIKSSQYYKGEDGLKTEVIAELLYSNGLGTRKAEFKDQFDFIVSHKDLFDEKLRQKKDKRSEDSWSELIKSVENDMDTRWRKING